MSSKNLVFKAGPVALDQIRRNGFSPESIGTIAGASGGAKWLVLSQLDRVIVDTVLPRLVGPVHLIGTSIGGWRFACYAQENPRAAIDRFEEAYITQRYSDAPDRTEITERGREMIATVLAGSAIQEVLGNPTLRLHTISVRARHITAAEQRHLLGAGLLGAAAMNALHRRLLGLFFERALFYDPRDLPPFFDVRGFPVQKVPLTPANLEDAIVSTGSIPLVLHGVRDIAGARPGTYRDGGIIDYHLDIPHSAPGKLTLYPHFFDRIVPGWFDKRFSWRRAAPSHVAATVLISPSAEFVARLPGGKVTDRTDFQRYAPAERIRVWRQVVAECQALADELHEVLERDDFAARLEPLD